MEKDIEGRCCALAEKAGWYQRKITSPGHNGMPDRLFIKRHRANAKPRVVFIEFKKPGKKPRALQEVEHRELLATGVEVHVCDNEYEFRGILGIPRPKRSRAVPGGGRSLDEDPEGVRVLGRHGSG